MKKSFAALAAALMLASCAGETATDTIKAGFIYVGPIGDYGWSHAHDVGRRYVDDKYDWLETVFVESVAEADAPRIIDRLVNEEKVDIVFTTSFGYMDATIAAGAQYPDTLFMHCSGFKNSANVGTYFAELYQMYYLNGIMAGALTKTGKVGYVGAFPIPEVVRHINAFALGVKVSNPNATVDVRWIFDWYNPTKARQAAEAMVAEGVDAFAFTEDSPAIIEVAQENMANGKYVVAFGHYSPMQSYGPDAAPSGQLVDWGVMYDKIFTDMRAGTWSNEDMWWMAKEKAALLGAAFDAPVNPAFVDQLKAVSISVPGVDAQNVYDLVMFRLQQFNEGTYEPFTGPIADQTGTIRIPAGTAATKGELLSINYFFDNVVGTIPEGN